MTLNTKSMKAEKNQESQQMALTDHLRELRVLVIRGLIAIGVASSLSLFFSKEIYRLLSLPLVEVLPPESTMIATHPIEAWLVYLKVGVFTGALLAIPYLFTLIWRFISPGLYDKEKKIALPLAVVFGFLFLGGSCFGYFVVFPIGFKALISIMGDTTIRFLPSMQNYLSFSMMLLVAFGIVFELPLLIIGLTGTGVISHRRLSSFRKYLVVVSLVVAAILTPPDPISQILMAIPLMILFEIGMAVSWIFNRNKQEHSELSCNEVRVREKNDT